MTATLQYLRLTTRQIRDDGLTAVVRKLRRLIEPALVYPLALLSYPFLLLLRPLLLVRFGSLTSYRLGHFAYRIAFYAAERDLGMHGGRTLDIFCFRPEKPSNEQLGRIAARVLHVWQPARYFMRLYRSLPGGGAHLVKIHTEVTNKDRDLDGVLARTETSAFFTPEEQQAGQAALRDMGVPADTDFVCFFARTNHFLQQTFPDQPRYARAHHNHRNADIDTYLPAMEKLTSRGGYALRLGAIVDKPIETGSARIIDYASLHRSDFMDIYLMANCRFMVSTGSGPDSVAELFRRPVVFVNQATLEAVNLWLHNLTIFKKYRLPNEGRIMSFREIVESGAGRLLDAEDYAQRGIELIDNTPEEIEDVVLEMDARLRGEWQGTEEDEELQQRFWRILERSPLQGYRCGRIGAAFLRKNRQLLD